MCMEEGGVESAGREELGDMLSNVAGILDHITSKRVQHLFHMKGSQRYLQRLSEELQHYLRLSNRASSQALEMAAKREHANTTLSSLQPQLTSIIRHTKTLQKQISGEISTRYKNRVVNIMGEINQI